LKEKEDETYVDFGVGHHPLQVFEKDEYQIKGGASSLFDDVGYDDSIYCRVRICSQG